VIAEFSIGQIMHTADGKKLYPVYFKTEYSDRRQKLVADYEYFYLRDTLAHLFKITEDQAEVNRDR